MTLVAFNETFQDKFKASFARAAKVDKSRVKILAILETESGDTLGRRLLTLGLNIDVEISAVDVSEASLIVAAVSNETIVNAALRDEALPGVAVAQEIVVLSYAPENASTRRGPFEVTPGRTLNSTHLTCPSPVWPYEGGTFDFELSDGGMVVQTPGVLNSTDQLMHRLPVTIDFGAEILALSPRSGVVGGSTVTIVGAGLDPSRAKETYVCGFQDDMENSSLVRATPDGALGTQQTLICPLPDWRQGAGMVFVRVTDTAKDVEVHPYVDISFQLLEVFHGIWPERGPASGATNVTILGRGFLNETVYVVVMEHGATRLSVVAQFVNESVLLITAPRWPSQAAQAETTVYKPAGLVNQSNSVFYTYYEVVEKSSPDHGRVFGSYMTIQGAGFTSGDRSYMCVLSPRSPGPVPDLYSEFVSPESSSSLECIFPAWGYTAQTMKVSLMHNGSPVSIIDISDFQLTSAWIAASLPETINFQGGMPITVIGKGFDPLLASGYTCQLLDTSNPSCYAEHPDCIQQTSSDHTIPELYRGPFNATSTTEIVCWVPSWLKENPHAILRLLAGKTLVEKVYSTAQTTEFVGTPTMHSGGNSPARGGLQVMLVGRDFGLVDLTPQVRIGNTACDSTVWLSSTSLSCKIPKAINGTLTTSIAVTVGPWRIGTSARTFEYDQ